MAGRQPQDQAAGVADQPAGDGDQPTTAASSGTCTEHTPARSLARLARRDGIEAEFIEPMRHFADCLAGTASPETSFDDGFCNVVVVHAIRRNLNEKRPIELAP